MTYPLTTSTKPRRLPRAAALALLLAASAACQTASPERVLRDERALASAPAEPLCRRMTEDFGMRVAAGDLAVGRTFEANLIDTMISGRGVTFVLKLEDARPQEDCVAATEGVVCDVVGPAVLTVRSNIGQAVYRVAASDTARVVTQGARLSCREPARPRLGG